MSDKEYICEYCGKLFNNGRSLGGHKSNCKLNPNHLKFCLIKGNTLKEYNKLIHKNIKYINKKFFCKKCKKLYLLNLKLIDYFNNNYTKYCSRSCANSRNHSKLIKNKIRLSIIENIKNNLRMCRLCGCYFSTTKKSKQYLCNNCKDKFVNKKCLLCGNLFNTKNRERVLCKGCISKYNSFSSDKRSTIFKKSYKNTNRKIGGGTTKWYIVLTSNGTVKVQGTYEVRMCKILDKIKNNNLIKDWLYTNDRIQYVGLDNKLHSYLFDFKVWNNDNTIKYILTKGYLTLTDLLKWKAARLQNIDLEVCFNENIKVYLQKYNINK